VAGGSGLTYKWAHSGESTASVVISQPGNFELAVTNDSGCESKESFVVKDDCSLPLWIPDAFSPNADGQNDIFGMYSPVGLELRLWIYNRWGSVVFYSESQDNTWDGYYEGVMSPPDSYAWKIEYRPKRKREDPFESKAGVVWILQ
jgi:gliding motility-associated-like protein